MCLAMAGLVGWPFAAAVGLPMVVEEVVLKAWYTKLTPSLQAVMALRTCALLLVVVVCCILIAVRLSICLFFGPSTTLTDLNQDWPSNSTSSARSFLETTAR